MTNENSYGATSADATDWNDATDSGRFGASVNWIEHAVVVAVSGDLDMLTAPALAEAIRAAVRNEPKALIVDLSGVGFLASAGMNLLLAAHLDTAPPMRFLVVADGPATGRPLKLVGIDTIVAVYRTLDDALADLVAH